jgi:hypothetical protein
MPREFDREELASLGWRQGAILGKRLSRLAWEHAPERVSEGANDHLVVTSHDCDVLNASLEKEPVVEVLRARVPDDHQGSGKAFSSGRNPRALRLSHVPVRGQDIPLDLVVHDRWAIPRALLVEGRPADSLPDAERRLVAEWLVKRYIRAAFPTGFDYRWRGKSKAWRKLLKKYSPWVQGVYLRLHTLRELPNDKPYRCHLLLAVPEKAVRLGEWLDTREALEDAFTKFWDPFQPAIQCEGVEALTTDRITLADIERYQRFDADWVSFDDETAVTPLSTDFRA